jgi:predicted transcriptional regulator
MRRSHLERYIDIISVLAQKGPLNVTLLIYKTDLKCSELKGGLDFLVTQGLVEERTIGKAKTVFAVTQRGINVVKYFQEFKQTLPIIDEVRDQATPFHECSLSSISQLK